ncbi:MAG: hypothetical protein ABIP74_02075 [Candidatus Saccharimonas sp.]
MSEKTVTVKGTIYDKRTGMPLHLERGELHSKSAQQIHHSLQKSKTLNRRYVKKDAATPARQESTTSLVATHSISTHHHVQAPQKTVRPQAVTHFTAAPVHASQQRVISDIGPTPHRLAVNASKKLAKPQMHTTVKPSQILKQEAIAQAMARTPAKHDRKDVIQPKHPKMRRLVSIASASMAVLLLGGYFTYLSMPSISTRVAAAQAGIAANYPGYQPMGYSLSGPVAYQQGRVTMTFAANAGPSTYTLDQTKSGWDSSAVLDSYVKPHAGDDYQTTTSNGLTIYTYGSNAAWVNGGIFYTISGNAPLSDDQIQHIATSL